MNKEPKHPKIDPELEARIVALVMGEASDFESEQLNRLFELRPELAAFKLQMQHLHGLLQEAGTGEFSAPAEDWKLPADRRNAVLAAIRGEASVPAVTQEAITVQAASVQAVAPAVDAPTQQCVPSKRKWRWTVVRTAAGVCVLGFVGMMALPWYFSDGNATSDKFVAMLSVDERYDRGPLSGGRNLSFELNAVGLKEQSDFRNSTQIEEAVSARFRPLTDAKTASPQRGSVLDSSTNRQPAVALSAIQDTLKGGAILPSDSSNGLDRYDDNGESRPTSEGIAQSDSRAWERSPLTTPTTDTYSGLLADSGVAWFDSAPKSQGVADDALVSAMPSDPVDLGVRVDSPDDGVGTSIDAWDKSAPGQGDDAKSLAGAMSSGGTSQETPANGSRRWALPGRSEESVRRFGNFNAPTPEPVMAMDDAAGRGDVGRQLTEETARSGSAESPLPAIALPAIDGEQPSMTAKKGYIGTESRGLNLADVDSPEAQSGTRVDTVFNVYDMPAQGSDARPGLTQGQLQEGKDAIRELSEKQMTAPYGGRSVDGERFGNESKWSENVEFADSPEPAGGGFGGGGGVENQPFGEITKEIPADAQSKADSKMDRDVRLRVAEPESRHKSKVAGDDKAAARQSGAEQDKSIAAFALGAVNGRSSPLSSAIPGTSGESVALSDPSPSGAAAGGPPDVRYRTPLLAGTTDMPASPQNTMGDELLSLVTPKLILDTDEESVGWRSRGRAMPDSKRLSEELQQEHDSQLSLSNVESYDDVATDKSGDAVESKSNGEQVGKELTLSEDLARSNLGLSNGVSDFGTMGRSLNEGGKDSAEEKGPDFYAGHRFQLLDDDFELAAKPESDSDADGLRRIMDLSKKHSNKEQAQLFGRTTGDEEPQVKGKPHVFFRQGETARPSLADIMAREKKPVAAAAVPSAGWNETNAAEEAFSTFSLHVSDVSFKLAFAALGRGEWPDAAGVRVEEFVNAFDYGDPMPCHDDKVACSVEQSIHPFVQQRNLLRVSMRTAAAGRSANTPLRLTFLLDNSGSMERTDRQQTVRRAFSLLAQQLTPIDQVTLISFARQPRLLADKVSGAEAGKLVSLIDELPSEGGTNIEAALQLAYEKAREHQTPNAQNRIILLTDGAVNLGNANPESLSQLVTTMRSTGIAFDAAGISAEGLNDEVLEALTRKGDGRYYLMDSLDDADEGFARQIAGALRPSAKNVKVQVAFNPKRVGHYKLLGFEKHILKTEDFRNDSVDAAEMAAAEAGVAMYQFEAKPDGEGDVGSVSVRFLDLSTGQMVENRWPIPYDADAPRPDQAAPSLRIATSAAMLAAKLRGEPLGEAVDLQTLSHLIAGLPPQDRNDGRVQQLQQMIEQARQLSEK